MTEYIEELSAYYLFKLRDAAKSYVKNLPEELRPTYPAVQKEVLNIFVYTDQEFADQLNKMQETLNELKHRIPFLQNPDFWKRVDSTVKMPYSSIDFFHKFFPPTVGANYSKWFKQKQILKQTLKTLAILEHTEQAFLEQSQFVIFAGDYVKLKTEIIIKRESAIKNLEQIVKETTEETRNYLLLIFPELPEDYDVNPPGG